MLASILPRGALEPDLEPLDDLVEGRAVGDIIVTRAAVAEPTKTTGNVFSTVESFFSHATHAVATAAAGEFKNLTKESQNLLHSLTDDLEGELGNLLNDIAKHLGLRDFYSAHVMDLCEGYYVPGPLPNATVPKGSIHKNATACTNTTAMFHFNPRAYIAKELKEKTDGAITLDDLHWSNKIDKGLKALNAAQKATFVLYCISIGLIFVALVMAAISIFLNGRFSAFINLIMDLFAFSVILVTSALVTYVANRITHLINKYGDDIGIRANRGDKFLVLTWVATGLMFVASLVWCFDCVAGRRRNRSYKEEKHG